MSKNRDAETMAIASPKEKIFKDTLRVVLLTDVDGNACLFKKERYSERVRLEHNKALVEFLGYLQKSLSAKLEVKQHAFTAKMLVKVLEHLYWDYQGGLEDLSESLALLSMVQKKLEDEGVEFTSPPIFHVYDVLVGRDLGDTFNSEKIASREVVKKEVVTTYAHSEHRGLEGIISSSKAVEALIKKLEAKISCDHTDDIFAQLYALVVKKLDAAESESLGDEEDVSGFEMYFDWAGKDEELLRQLEEEGHARDQKTSLLLKVFELYGTENVLYIWTDDRKDLYDQIINDLETKIITDKGEELLSDVVQRCVVFIEQKGIEQKRLFQYCSQLNAAVEEMTERGLNKAFAEILKEALNEDELRERAGIPIVAAAAGGAGAPVVAPSLRKDVVVGSKDSVMNKVTQGFAGVWFSCGEGDASSDDESSRPGSRTSGTSDECVGGRFAHYAAAARKEAQGKAGGVKWGHYKLR